MVGPGPRVFARLSFSDVVLRDKLAEAETFRAPSGRSLTECGVALAGLQQVRIAIGEPLRVAAELDGKIDARAVGCVLGDADLAALTRRGLVIRDRPGGIAIEYLAAQEPAERAAATGGELARRCEGTSCAAAMLGPPDARLWLQLAVDKTMRLRLSGPDFHRFAAAANALLDELRSTSRDGALLTFREQGGALWIEAPADLSIGSSVLVALNLRAQLIESFKIPSSSMVPTILMNDDFFIGKGRLLGDPVPGDLLVFRQGTGMWVKRYLAGPGQTIAETESGIAIDGKLLATEVVDPAYRYQDGESGRDAHERTGALVREHLGARSYLIVRTGPPRSTGSWTVPPGQLFLVGDNRNNSNDSRYLGAIPRDAIVGRVLGTWFAMRDGAPDWDRIGIPLE
jgi:signal peptidase I